MLFMRISPPTDNGLRSGRRGLRQPDSGLTMVDHTTYFVEKRV